MSRKSTSVAPVSQERPKPLAECDVILDIALERGMLYFELENIGSAPAHAVRVKLDKAVRDLAGHRVNDNPLYVCLEFLAPGRRIRLLVDSMAGYIERRQPMKFNVKLQWVDDSGQASGRAIVHDLTAWTQLRDSF